MGVFIENDHNKRNNRTHELGMLLSRLVIHRRIVYQIF